MAEEKPVSPLDPASARTTTAPQSATQTTAQFSSQAVGGARPAIAKITTDPADNMELEAGAEANVQTFAVETPGDVTSSEALEVAEDEAAADASGFLGNIAGLGGVAGGSASGLAMSAGAVGLSALSGGGGGNDTDTAENQNNSNASTSGTGPGQTSQTSSTGTTAATGETDNRGSDANGAQTDNSNPGETQNNGTQTGGAATDMVPTDPTAALNQSAESGEEGGATEKSTDTTSTPIEAGDGASNGSASDSGAGTQSGAAPGNSGGNETSTSGFFGAGAATVNNTAPLETTSQEGKQAEQELQTGGTEMDKTAAPVTELASEQSESGDAASGGDSPTATTPALPEAPASPASLVSTIAEGLSATTGVDIPTHVTLDSTQGPVLTADLAAMSLTSSGTPDGVLDGTLSLPTFEAGGGGADPFAVLEALATNPQAAPVMEAFGGAAETAGIAQPALPPSLAGAGEMPALSVDSFTGLLGQSPMGGLLQASPEDAAALTQALSGGDANAGTLPSGLPGELPEGDLGLGILPSPQMPARSGDGGDDLMVDGAMSGISSTAAGAGSILPDGLGSGNL